MNKIQNIDYLGTSEIEVSPYVHKAIQFNDDVKRCRHCNSDQHLVRDCDKAKGNQNTQGTRSTYQRSSINKIQVTPTDDVSEETKTKIVMKCGVNLKTNHQEIMPEQIVAKQTVKKEESNALKKIPLKHVTVEIR